MLVRVRVHFKEGPGTKPHLTCFSSFSSFLLSDSSMPGMKLPVKYE